MSVPSIAYWSSGSGNTRRFVERLDLPSVLIPNSGVMLMEAPYVLITPTFANGEGRGAVPKPVIRFLNQEGNRRLLTGVAGSGNRNFGAFFGIGAKVCAQKCGVPLVHLFELAGDANDVRIVSDIALRAAA